MTVTYQKQFLKDLAKVPAARRSQMEQFVFEVVPQLNSIFATGKVEHMTGYPGYYKIRFGDYRIGVKITGDIVSFERVLHRREIYRYFP